MWQKILQNIKQNKYGYFIIFVIIVFAIVELIHDLSNGYTCKRPVSFFGVIQAFFTSAVLILLFGCNQQLNQNVTPGNNRPHHMQLRINAFVVIVSCYLGVTITLTTWLADEKTNDAGCLTTQEDIFIIINISIGFCIFFFLFLKLMMILICRRYEPNEVHQEPIDQADVGLSSKLFDMIPVIIYIENMQPPELPRKKNDESVEDVENKCENNDDMERKDMKNCCTICLNNYKGGDRLKELPSCKHYFHIECIKTWLSRKDLCPNCRKVVVEKDLRVENSEA